MRVDSNATCSQLFSITQSLNLRRSSITMLKRLVSFVLSLERMVATRNSLWTSTHVKQKDLDTLSSAKAAEVLP